jgi:hypothetical protein
MYVRKHFELCSYNIDRCSSWFNHITIMNYKQGIMFDVGYRTLVRKKHNMNMCVFYCWKESFLCKKNYKIIFWFMQLQFILIDTFVMYYINRIYLFIYNWRVCLSIVGLDKPIFIPSYSLLFFSSFIFFGMYSFQIAILLF